MAENIKKLLIAGDSFAALWPNTNKGWVNLLAEKFNVVNVAQAGVGEYKIYKQLVNLDINQFDAVIVSHTSPSRIHTPGHPLHTKGFHKDCDLIITDLMGHFNPFNSKLRSAKLWFENHYDDEYQIDIYKLLREKINSMINITYISLSHIEIANTLAVEQNHIDFSQLWKNNRGTINHYTEEGNLKVYNEIIKCLT